MPGSASMRAFSLRAIASVTCFSCVPRRPRAPGSSPPWPASTTTVSMRGAGGLGPAGAGFRGSSAAGGSVDSFRCRRAISGSGGTTGYTSITSRWPYSPIGLRVKICGFASPFRSTTSRTTPGLNRPARRAVTYGSSALTFFADCSTMLRKSTPSRSSTSRSGFLSAVSS